MELGKSITQMHLFVKYISQTRQVMQKLAAEVRETVAVAQRRDSTASLLSWRGSVDSIKTKYSKTRKQ